MTGIKKRFLSTEKETSENLAIKVCKKLKKSEIKDISHIISVTNTPSIKFPGISNFISSKLDLTNVFCINLNSGCTGYVDALLLAYNIIYQDKKSKVLIVTSDTYSKYINKNNRSIKPLFSDGSTATIIKFNSRGFKFISRENINIKDTQKDLILNNSEIEMNGPAVVSLALKHVIPSLKKFSKDIEALYLHQAGKIVISLLKNELRKNIFIPTNYEKYGNLVSSSIPILIKENLKGLTETKKL